MAGRPHYFLTTKSIVYSILVHAVLGALLLVSFTSAPIQVFAPPAGERIEPVKARMVSEAEVQQQLKKIKQAELEKRKKEEQAQQKVKQLLAEAKQLERKKKEEENKLAEAKKKRLQEKKKAEQLAKKRKLEQQKLAKAEKERKEKAKKEKARKEAAAKKKREEAAKKAKERKKQRELAEKKKREAALQARLDEERLSRRVDSLLGRYIPIIRQKVSRNWNKPANTPKGIEAKVQVRLTATGEVVSVRLVRSSGNSVFDRSVENAVHKASPLPIPQEHGVNERFRNLNLIFKPEDLLS